MCVSMLPKTMEEKRDILGENMIALYLMMCLEELLSSRCCFSGKGVCVCVCVCVCVDAAREIERKLLL